MLTSSWVLVVIGVLALAGGVAAAGWVRRRRGRTLASFAGVVTGLAVLVGLTEAWAHAMADRSGVARAIAWMDADVDDIHRFPAREVSAGSTPLALGQADLPAATLERVTVRGRGTDLDDLIQKSQTEALLVLRGRDLVFEGYANGGTAEQRHTSFSVAKSMLSTLLGIAIERGEVGSLDDPVTDYVPELLDEDRRFAEITLRHLVSMSSGICYAERKHPWSDDSETYYSADLRATALSAEVCEPPGRTWLYNNYNPLLVGLVLERATGSRLTDYMSRHLWRPMGAEADASWSLDSDESGFEKMESGVNARPRDFARFGYLFAHDGRVEDQQVVDRRWVREATARSTARDPADHYQLWWWVDTERPGRFFAAGNKGQFVYVDPSTDVVVVRLGRTDGDIEWPKVLRDIADRVNKTVR